jgi:large subunit ribosomal protein L18
VDDQRAATLCACSSLEKELRANLKSARDQGAAKEVGKILAERAKKQDIKKVVFDRNGFIYHGRVKALAEGARDAGLEF